MTIKIYHKFKPSFADNLCGSVARHEIISITELFGELV
jgi:hypothetical protein